MRTKQLRNCMIKNCLVVTDGAWKIINSKHGEQSEVIKTWTDWAQISVKCITQGVNISVASQNGAYNSDAD